jgi:hypothetical protein
MVDGIISRTSRPLFADQYYRSRVKSSRSNKSYAVLKHVHFPLITIMNQLTNSKEQGLLEKLIIPELVKQFAVFCGTPRFITASTTARHLPLF